jgi:hypothetical protein
MTQPVNREVLARQIYIHVHDHTLTAQEAVKVHTTRATEWDNDIVTPEDRAYFYAEADAQLAEKGNR